MDNAQLSAGLRALDLTGVFANATLGALIARAARLDPIGVGTLAILAGLGGGIIRDVLLQQGPPTALTDYAYLLTALGGAALGFLIPLEGRTWNRLWPLVDALALGCWAAAGAQKTLVYGLGWLPAVLLGTVTAVGGVFVLEMVIGKVPSILGGNTLYATCALAASGIMVVLYRAGHPNIGSVVATLAGAGFVLLARWRHWMLPQGDQWSPLTALRSGYVNRTAHLHDKRGETPGEAEEEQR